MGPRSWNQRSRALTTIVATIATHLVFVRRACSCRSGCCSATTSSSPTRALIRPTIPAGADGRPQAGSARAGRQLGVSAGRVDLLATQAGHHSQPRARRCRHSRRVCVAQRTGRSASLPTMGRRAPCGRSQHRWSNARRCRASLRVSCLPHDYQIVRLGRTISKNVSTSVCTWGVNAPTQTLATRRSRRTTMVVGVPANMYSARISGEGGPTTMSFVRPRDSTYSRRPTVVEETMTNAYRSRVSWANAATTGSFR